MQIYFDGSEAAISGLMLLVPLLLLTYTELPRGRLGSLLVVALLLQGRRPVPDHDPHARCCWRVRDLLPCCRSLCQAQVGGASGRSLVRSEALDRCGSRRRDEYRRDRSGHSLLAAASPWAVCVPGLSSGPFHGWLDSRLGIPDTWALQLRLQQSGCLCGFASGGAHTARISAVCHTCAQAFSCRLDRSGDRAVRLPHRRLPGCGSIRAATARIGAPSCNSSRDLLARRGHGSVGNKRVARVPVRGARCRGCRSCRVRRELLA